MASLYILLEVSSAEDFGILSEINNMRAHTHAHTHHTHYCDLVNNLPCQHTITSSIRIEVMCIKPKDPGIFYNYTGKRIYFHLL